MNTSRTISGFLCLCATSLPLVIAPFRFEQSLGFVAEMENRTPNAFPALANRGDLMDADWWALVSLAFEDRTPFREESLQIEKRLNPAGGVASRSVAFGKGNWLFWYMALAEDFGSVSHVQRAMDAMDRFVADNSFSADLFILAAPDKATIYPEMLNEDSLAIFEPSIPQRTLLHDSFTQDTTNTRLDIWTKLLDRKDEFDGLIYEPAGTHYNSIGAMVMAKAMVDAADAADIASPSSNTSLWESDWIESEYIDLWTRTEAPELALRGGVYGRTETATRSQVRRQGVEVVELWDGDQRIENPEYLSITEIEYHNIKRIVSKSDTRPMIAGRTLVIHDSFIAVYLYPTLTQYFEDIEFIHVGYITPADFRSALDTYDRVYFESAEHYFPRRAIEYFEMSDEQSSTGGES